MSEELKAALARIACLEGEIAKRDETIARLEPQLNRAIQANYDLREELAACRVAVENCEVFRARIAELEADRDSHQRCAIQAMAELAAIKAQGVVMPDVNAAAKALCNRHAMICGVDAGDQWKEHSQDFIADAETVLANARLNAAPVQQVSVPDGWRIERRELDGSVCFIIGAPRLLGVRANTSVWESDSDPAHLLLWHMLAAHSAKGVV